MDTIIVLGPTQVVVTLFQVIVVPAPPVPSAIPVATPAAPQFVLRHDPDADVTVAAPTGILSISKPLVATVAAESGIPSLFWAPVLALFAGMVIMSFPPMGTVLTVVNVIVHVPDWDATA